MKKILVNIFFIFIFNIFLFGLTTHVSYAACLRMTGTFTADNNWPGGTVHISCRGDDFPGISNCTGDSKDISPGETFDFQNCSCIADGSGEGCLHVDSVPAQCTSSTQSSPICGTNGNTLPADFTVSCQAPPTPTICTKVEDDYNQCGGECNGVNYAITHRVFVKHSTCGYVCEDQGEKPECSNLTPTPTGAGTPTVTIRPPTSTPGAGTPTSIPPTPTRVPTATLTPGPTVTPTPLPLDLASCKCDGLDATGIFPRANVTFSAFAKVLGTNTSLATVRDITFSVYESPKNQPNTALRIAQSSAIAPQVISQSSSLIRYKSNWNFNYPYKVNTLYRVIAQINCVKKTAMGPASVLAAQTAQPNWIQDIFAGIGRQFDLLIVRPFFGGGSEQSSSAPASNLPAGRQGAAAATPTQTAGQRNALQLQTIQSAQVLEKSCTLIKFTFNNQ